jgi:hypothetical protein
VAKLGDFFPKIFRDKVAAQVSPGAVVYTLIKFDDGREREKFVVIAHVQEKFNVALCFLINKEKHPHLVAAVPAIDACQIELKQADETYLSEDSFLACEKIRTFTQSELVEEVRNKPENLRGQICKATVQAAIAAVAIAPNISADHKAQITASLTKLL